MKILVYIIFVLASFNAFAQNGTKEKADREFELMKYSHAIEHYEQYLEKNTADDSAKLHLAQAYHKIKDTKNSERVFRNISNLDNISPKAGLEFAEVLSQNGNYEEAQLWFSKYNHEKADDNIHAFYLDSSRYKIYYLGFNTPQSDFSPSFYKNGIVFASGRIMEHGVRRVFSWDNSAFLDLYFVDTTSIDTTHFITDRTHSTYSKEELEASTKKKALHHDDTRITSNDTHTLGYHASTFNPDSAWQVAGTNMNVIPFSKKINSKYHEGPVVFANDQNTVYFTRNNFRPGKYKTSEEDINELKIYIATKAGNGDWTNVKEFVHNNNQFSTGHPALSADNQTMYFVSNMPGGVGGTDLYVSKWENGNWSKPVNAGNTINTTGNEMFPFVSADNRLFFASSGHGGLGGLDIFEYDLNDKSAEVINMGFPVNSMKDDFGLIINKSGSTGYFSSNRKRGGTDDDLFMFTRKPQPVVEPKTESKPELEPEPTIITTVTPSPEIPEEVYQIRNIYFDFDKSFVRADAIPVMNEIIDLLKKYPNLKISLSSHTDSRANHDYNVKLSQRRMNASIAYLAERGITADRIVSKTFDGETKLVNNCGDKTQAECNAQQHQLNRRTDFQIIKE